MQRTIVVPFKENHNHEKNNMKQFNDFLKKWTPKNKSLSDYWKSTPGRVYWAVSYDAEPSALLEMAIDFLAIELLKTPENNSSIAKAHARAVVERANKILTNDESSLDFTTSTT